MLKNCQQIFLLMYNVLPNMNEQYIYYIINLC